MDTLFNSPDVATCIGCGVECGVVGDFGLADPLCPACAQSAWRWDAERTISDTVSIILGRPPFDCLSREDRQELLNEFHAGIGYVPEAVKPQEAAAWLNPPHSALSIYYNVQFRTSNGTPMTFPWATLAEARQCVDRIRANGTEAQIDGYLY
jgi:hypothetical protein